MPSVLIVDDADFMRRSISSIVAGEGWHVAGEASNGREAVELYRQHKPDIVTMDVTMPEMDGLESLRSILALDPAARVVMCSSLGQQAIVIEAIQAGARDFIVKPFSCERVLEALKRSLNS